MAEDRLQTMGFTSPETIIAGGRRQPSLVEVLRRHKGKPVPSPLSRFKSTLVGYLLDLISTYGPMSTEAVIANVQGNIRSLRKLDGSKYTEDVDRSVNGCLGFADRFTWTETGWIVEPEAANRFIEKTIQAIEKQDEDQKAVPDLEEGTPKSRCKKIRLVSNITRKSQRLLAMILSFSKTMHSDPDVAKFVANPLPKLRGNEDISDVIRTLGEDRAAGLVIAYDLLKENYSQICDEGYQSSEGLDTAHIMRKALERLIQAEETIKEKKKRKKRRVCEKE